MQEVSDATASLDAIKSEIAEKQRLKARNATLAAVAAATAAQQDAEIKAIEEEIFLLENKTTETFDRGTMTEARSNVRFGASCQGKQSMDRIAN